ncbi:hypothetical protein KUCAC02_015219 [Chaenocephalus aceratus]|uniref:Uncharacterized protein n=1 Tax=Chaenocephalus aceratus TaxID=36190 RepID=A0ACB9XXQ9_CHAAC|nr:hypothetical protein KUCAC02_015219 [Chaenocephalus aceratus]
MANRAAGKGYENEDHYTNIKLHFIGIENIHVMRSSQQKVIDGKESPRRGVGEMRFPSMTDFLYGLENSGWLKHIKAILDAGLFIARAVADEGVSVLVHCSDGWDRTAQACSVASILLDPYYRTIRGLMVLIERDWVSFGHKFSHRYGHLDGDPKEVSPVIDQFVEVCVAAYGTFLGNCQKESAGEGHELGERTHSVWPELWKERAQYTNPLYRAEQSQSQGVLRPNTHPLLLQSEDVEGEESQQLEEELANQQERIAALTGEPITWEEVLRRRTSAHDPPTAGRTRPCLIQTQTSSPPPTPPAGSPSAADLGVGSRRLLPRCLRGQRPGAWLGGTFLTVVP